MGDRLLESSASLGSELSNGLRLVLQLVHDLLRVFVVRFNVVLLAYILVLLFDHIDPLLHLFRVLLIEPFVFLDL